jgi:transposase
VIRNVEEAMVLHECQPGRGIVYATRLLQAFQDAHALHGQLRREELTLEAYQGAGYAIQSRVTQLLERVTLQSKVNERLRKGLLKHHQRGNLLRFLEDPSVPPTNNAAERNLRSGVTARKVSQCSETQRGADGDAMIKSVVETAKRQAQHPLDVLVCLQVRAAPR